MQKSFRKRSDWLHPFLSRETQEPRMAVSEFNWILIDDICMIQFTLNIKDK